MDEQQKKITLPEIIIFLLLNGGADALDIAADLAAVLPFIGQALLLGNAFVGFSVLAATQFWLIMKGGIAFKKQATYLTGALIDLIPILNALPTKTITLIIAMYLINQQGKSGSSEAEVESGKSSAVTKEQGAAAPALSGQAE